MGYSRIRNNYKLKKFSLNYTPLIDSSSNKIDIARVQKFFTKILSL